MEFTPEQWKDALDNAKKAAADGNVEAMKAAAILIRVGSTGEEDNLSEAFPYYKQAADAGDAECAEIVAVCYGRQRKDELAFKYMKQAADAGIARAQRQVGYHYSSGLGCESDDRLAKQYFEKAALQNDGIAQWELSELMMYTMDGLDETEKIAVAANAAEWGFLAYVNGVQEAVDFIRSSDMWGTAICNTMIEKALKKRAAMCGEEKTPAPDNRRASSTSESSHCDSVGKAEFGEKQIQEKNSRNTILGVLIVCVIGVIVLYVTVLKPNKTNTAMLNSMNESQAVQILDSPTSANEIAIDSSKFENSTDVPVEKIDDTSEKVDYFWRVPESPQVEENTLPTAASFIESPYNGFIFPNSNTEYITVEQIDAYANTKDTCQRAVSELFARYGYEFKNETTLAFFNQYDWYVNMDKRHDEDSIISGFNEIEKANFDMLRAYENEHGWG